MNSNEPKLFKDLPAFIEPPEINGAIESYRRAIEKEPENASNYYQLGKALQAKGKKLSALEAFQEAVRKQKTYVPAYCAIAGLYAGVGKLRLAMREYMRALTLAPDSPDIIYNLALCYEQLRNYSKAYSLWKRYETIEKNPIWLEDARKHMAECSSNFGKGIKKS